MNEYCFVWIRDKHKDLTATFPTEKTKCTMPPTFWFDKEWFEYLIYFENVSNARMRKRRKFILFVDHHDFFFPGHSMMPLKKNIRNIFARIEYHYFRRFLSKYILKTADKIFPVTEVCKDHLISYFKIPETKIISMDFAVDTDIFYFDSTICKLSLGSVYDFYSVGISICYGRTSYCLYCYGLCVIKNSKVRRRDL